MSATNRGAIRHAGDFYETPSWCVELLLKELDIWPNATIVDPGCGTGAISRALVSGSEVALQVTGIEADTQLWNQARNSVAAGNLNSRIRWIRDDYLLHHDRYDFAIGNPPYNQAMEFVQHAIATCDTVCMLLRLNWLGSKKRKEWLQAHPCDVYVLSGRPSFTSDGKTDATEYAWFVWGPGVSSKITIL